MFQLIKEKQRKYKRKFQENILESNQICKEIQEDMRNKVTQFCRRGASYKTNPNTLRLQ